MMQKEKFEEAKVLYKDANADQRYVLEQLFPELKESEEKIRKELLNYLKKASYGKTLVVSTLDYKRWADWLEKQGKPIDKIVKRAMTEKQRVLLTETNGDANIDWDTRSLQDVKLMLEYGLDYIKKLEKQGEPIKEHNVCDTCLSQASCVNPCPMKLVEKQNPAEPKFKEGDWIVRGKTIARILDIQEQYYVGLDIDGNDFTSSRFLSDDKIHLWSIQDAKTGDVLANKYGDVMLFKGITDDRHICGYCQYSAEDRKLYNECSDFPNYYPATKEQCDLLHQKMQEAGYEWDAEDKELKKIVAPIFHIGDRVRYKGHACDGVITEITDTDYICGNAKLPISTQDKLELVEQNPAWSEEDEKQLNDIIKLLPGLDIRHNWLRSLKYRVRLQPKQEWSDKDMNFLTDVEYLLRVVKMETRSDNEYQRAENCLAWLKSLKERYTWKPNDEQMEALERMVNFAHFDEVKNRDIVRILLNELKKLKD